MQKEMNLNLLKMNVLETIENHVAMICFDRQRRVVYVNSLFAKTMGYFCR